MTSGRRSRPAVRQAAAWMSKLNHRVVGQTTLADFRAWREQPENDAAFRALQSVLGRSGRLADDPESLQALAHARIAPPRRDRLAVVATGSFAVGLGALALAVVGFGSFGWTGDTYRTPVGVRSIIHPPHRRLHRPIGHRHPPARAAHRAWPTAAA